ncbi:hypothetical protein BB559_005514 [Furculomyces boomerangus]|uniref:Uncharacterized protein n=2 Tax=Harpellales TaxID=61421 RepID=A0A2T9Y8E1_9FUNG|nr:hypothetical protein BB559_005514 [Furculomyces boomerangus]PVZ97550.1 hypothetical protein BB558_006480 [Smittium angustum]PVZ99881.1 hypothetical protein BB558_004086 [Smittium angustum]
MEKEKINKRENEEGLNRENKSEEERETKYIQVSKWRRFSGHAFSGLTETDSVLVKYCPQTLESVSEPANKTLRNMTSFALLSYAAFSFYKRRQIIKRMQGLSSLVGVAPTLLSWSGSISLIFGLMNARPFTPTDD